jgi:hypothetical protein
MEKARLKDEQKKMAPDSKRNGKQGLPPAPQTQTKGKTPVRKLDSFSTDSSSENTNNSSGTVSSNATVKWKDASDLQFRMVTEVINSNSNSFNESSNSSFDHVNGSASAPGSSPRARSESRFERMSRTGSRYNNRSTSSHNSSNPNGASTGNGGADATNVNINENGEEDGIGARLQRLKETLFNALSINNDNPYYDDFTFTDFSSKHFAEVREFCGIDPDTYVKAFENTANEKFTEGRSGAFMFSSIDSRFIVKTTTEPELRKLLRIMPKYLKHLKMNPHTLIIKFLGAHCITMYSRKIFFLVMLNVFPREKLSEKYDLKGSWVNRSGKMDGSRLTRRERLMKNSTTRSTPLLLDNDLQSKINIEEMVARALRNQMLADSKFLASTYAFLRSRPSCIGIILF